jgi:hypothetical protein
MNLVDIKNRHQRDDSLMTADEDTHDVEQIHDDRGELIREYERFRSNYIVGLGLIDDFVNTHANTLPRRTREDLHRLQVRMRGLL